MLSSHEPFLQWTIDRGIITNGVNPTQILNRGLGIIANRRIVPGEELVSVPASALFSINSIPTSFRSMYKEKISAHGLLASFFAFSPRKHLLNYQSWLETWPRSEDFSSFPMCWDDNCRSSAFLPPGMVGGCWSSRAEDSEGEGLLCSQQTKFKRDWGVVSRVFPGRKVEEYRYGWLLVNTRSLYCDGLGGRKFKSREERMVLCPFVDLFNHDDHGEEPGEEIFVTYGSHSNDFLMVEYGFMLESNACDSLPIDDLVFQSFPSKEPAMTNLKQFGYFGDYTLTSSGPCHRTQVALRTQILPSFSAWKKWVECQSEEDEEQEKLAGEYLARKILDVGLAETNRMLRGLSTVEGREGKVEEEMMMLPEDITQGLVKRWEQIRDMILGGYECTGCAPLGGH